jgi:hypothetical protein
VQHGRRGPARPAAPLCSVPDSGDDSSKLRTGDGEMRQRGGPNSGEAALGTLARTIEELGDGVVGASTAVKARTRDRHCR